MEGDGVELGFGSEDGKNSRKGIVGSVGFDDPGQRWIKVMKNGCARKGAFERLEAQLGMLVEVPRSVLAGETCERYDDVRVPVDEASVEVGKSEE